MQDFGEAFRLAFGLVLTLDADLIEIIGLSLRVSLTAVGIACVAGLPFGAAIAMGRFRGRILVIVLLNALMGLPPVVVGVLVYLALSNAGPLGWLQLLYTPTAMVVAQTLLIPLVIMCQVKKAGPLKPVSIAPYPGVPPKINSYAANTVKSI